uniref:Uncharacterized protein n=1 Tax=Panagrolaimus sp. JU765 TaxID=591449 RepID=A0AC34REW6_9BILA
MTNDLNTKVIRQCQKLPHQFVEDMERQREAAELQNGNPIIKSSGVRVEPGRLVGVNAQLLQPPSICYQQTQKVLSTGVWGMLKNDLFFEPAHIRKLYFILTDERMDTRKAQGFCLQLLDRARCYGMRIDEEPMYKTWDEYNSQTVLRNLKEYADEGCTYAFIIGDSDELHHSMKYSELSTRLVTQNVRSRTVDRANNS